MQHTPLPEEENQDVWGVLEEALEDTPVDLAGFALVTISSQGQVIQHFGVAEGSFDELLVHNMRKLSNILENTID